MSMPMTLIIKVCSATDSGFRMFAFSIHPCAHNNFGKNPNPYILRSQHVTAGHDTTRSHVPVPAPQSQKESNRKGENPRSIVAPEPEHADSRHGRDDGM